MKFGVAYSVYDDHEYLETSINSINDLVDKILILISDVPWNGNKSDNSETIKRAKELCSNKKIELIEGHWTNEMDQRNHALKILYDNGMDYCLVIDADEIYHKQHLFNLFKYAESNPSIRAFHIEWNTYWKKSYHRIHPREQFKPLVLVKISNFLFTIIRGGITSVIRNASGVFKFEEKYNGVIVPSNIAICYHLSYAKTDEWIRRKLETNSHAKEFITDWYDNVWLGWKEGNRNLHPVTPQQYTTAVKEDFTIFPEPLKKFIKTENKNRICSIVVLNWNSKDLLVRCVELIRKNTKHPYEIIIVDNGSTEEGTKETVNSLNCKTVFNKENLGFSGGVNIGIRNSDKNTDICLLNVDAEPQDGWLEAIYETNVNYPNSGLIGPLGNKVASGWQKEGLFKEDVVVPNLMGFCLFIIREVIEKIGYFDERFKAGWEDNDIGARAIIAGYNLMISSKSLVVHEAHQVFKKNGLDYKDIDPISKEVFLQKIYSIMMTYSTAIDAFSQPEVAKKMGLLIE